jgi:hypothetical protein
MDKLASFHVNAVNSGLHAVADPAFGFEAETFSGQAKALCSQEKTSSAVLAFEKAKTAGDVSYSVELLEGHGPVIPYLTGV